MLIMIFFRNFSSMSCSSAIPFNTNSMTEELMRLGVCQQQNSPLSKDLVREEYNHIKESLKKQQCTTIHTPNAPPHNHKNFQSLFSRLLAKMAFSNRNVNVPCSHSSTMYILTCFFQKKNLNGTLYTSRCRHTQSAIIWL